MGGHPRTNLPRPSHPSIRVRMHSQLLSAARSHPAATLHGKQSEDLAPLDLARNTMAGENAAAPGDADGGSGSQWTWAQDHAQANPQTNLRGLRPCSRCRAQRKGVSYCVRLGHVPVAVSSGRTAAGGRRPGMRALLLISKCKDAGSELLLQSGQSVRENLLERFQLVSGVFQIEPRWLSGDVTPGKIREV